jgi:WD40 repeat protein
MSSDDTEFGPRLATTRLAREHSTARDGGPVDPPTDPAGPPSGGRDRKARLWLADLVEALNFVAPETTTTPDAESDDSSDPPALDEHLGKTVLFDRFELKDKVGEGGFGIVVRAYDRRLRRDVALKVPHPGRTLSRLDARSFLKDAHAPARLKHDNIVKVFDVGDLGPLGCYIVSEFCEGPNLRDWMRRRGTPVPPRLAARLIELLADAVQHAHDNGVLHRDVKPDNVLVASQPGRAGGDDGEPPAPGRSKPTADADLVPLLVDFGLARIADDGEESRSGHRLGTLAYSPPESAAGRRSRIGPRSDVYGLGATLYELLTGRPPFRGDDEAETMRLVMEADPVSPRSLRPSVPRDLETLCLKCLSKEPTDRLASAALLRDELRRFLNDEPIQTHPAPAWVRAWKFSRRRPIFAATVGFAVVGVVALIAGLAWRDSLVRRHGQELEREAQRANRLANEADAQRRVAEEKNVLAARHIHAANLREAHRALEAGKLESAQVFLNEVRPISAEADPSDFAWTYLRGQACRQVAPLSERLDHIEQLLQSPDRRFLALADQAGRIDVREVEQHRTRSRLVLKIPKSPWWILAFSRDSRLFIAVVPSPRATHPDSTTLHVTIGDVEAGRSVQYRCDIETVGPPVILDYDRSTNRLILSRVLRGNRHVLSLIGLNSPSSGETIRPIDWEVAAPAAVDPARDVLAIVSDGRITIRDMKSGATRATLDGGMLATTGGSPATLEFSEDGRYLAGSDQPAAGRVQLWEVATGRRVVDQCLDAGLVCSRPSALGKFLACLDRTGKITIIESARGSTRGFQISDHNPNELNYEMAFSPDERKLAVRVVGRGRNTALATVWDVESCRLEATYPGAPCGGALHFSADSRSLFLQGVRFPTRWRFANAEDIQQVSTGTEEVWAVAISPDGNTVAAGTDNQAPDARTIQLRDRTTGKLIAGWTGHTATVGALAFSPDGRSLASGSLDREGPNLIVWDVAGRIARTMLKGHTDNVRSVAFSPDGRGLLTASDDRTVRIWDLADGREPIILAAHADKVRRAVYSPDGMSIASASLDATVRIWDVATRRTTKVLTARRSLQTVVWSPNGTLLATADEEGDIVLWDPETGAKVRTMHTELDELRCLAFSPDGRNLAAAGVGKVVRVWDVLSGQEILSLPGHSAQINAVAFSPDGTLLVSADHAGIVKFWRADD